MRIHSTTFFPPSAALALVLLAAGCTPEASVDEQGDAVRTQILEVRELHRQTMAHPELRLANEQSFLEADEVFDEAVVLARRGRFTDATTTLRRAARRYRDASLAALASGPVATVAKELDAAAPTSGPIKVLARERLTTARKLLDDVRDAEFQVVAVVDAVYAELLSIHELLGGQQEVSSDVVCTAPVDAEVFGFEVSAPPPGRLLTHAPIYYLEGDSLEVSVLVPGCTRISQVSLILSGGTLELGTAPVVYDPIEGTSSNPYYYDLISRRTEPDGRSTLFLRLHFADFDDGRPVAVRIGVASVIDGPGLDGAELAFTVALVQRVGGEQIVGLGETEIRNGFIRDIYRDFGDDARNDDGDLYEPTYENLVFAVDESGLHYAWHVRADVENFCDPAVRIDGTFRIVREAGALEVVWDDDGPDVNIDFSWECDVAGTVIGPFFALIKGLARNNAQQEVRERLQHEVDDLSSALRGAVLAVRDIETLAGEVRVVLELPFDNVTIEVPYGSLRLENPHDLGLPLNPGDTVFALGSGLASACGISGEAHETCDTPINPNGLFNWNGPIGIPEPWELSESNIYVHFEERQKARRELVGVRREIDRLPVGDENVGVLLGRLGNADGAAQHRLINDSCVVRARDNGEDRLAIGANDYRYLGARENGHGNYRVSVVWPEGQDFDDCTARNLATLPGVLDLPQLVAPR